MKKRTDSSSGLDTFIFEHQKPLSKRSNKYSYLDSDTYVVRRFKQALNTNCLWKFAEFIGFKGNEYLLFFITDNITSGMNFVNVFRSREKLRPAEWFYNQTEELPEKISFECKHAFEDFLSNYSCGHLLFKEIKERYGTFNAVSVRYHVSITKLKNLIYTRNGLNGVSVFKSMATFEIIEAFKRDINPEYWFILPDELKDRKEKRKFSELLKKHISV